MADGTEDNGSHSAGSLIEEGSMSRDPGKVKGLGFRVWGLGLKVFY